MVGRALHGEVERDLHSVPTAGGDEPAEIVERAEFGMNRIVAALGGADGVEAAGIAGLGAQRVVAALAVGAADRMDRREIEHVEAERRDLRQPGDAIVERAVPARHLALAARHHLVPGAGARERAIHDQRKYHAAREVGLFTRASRGGDFVRQHWIELIGGRGAGESPDRTAVLARPRLDLLQKVLPLLHFQCDIEPGLLLREQIAPPSPENVAPGLDRIFVAAGSGGREARRPAIVRLRLHRHPRPGPSPFGAPDQVGRQQRMTVAEDVGPHLDRFAGDSLYGEIC